MAKIKLIRWQTDRCSNYGEFFNTTQLRWQSFYAPSLCITVLGKYDSIVKSVTLSVPKLENSWRENVASPVGRLWDHLILTFVFFQQFVMPGHEVVSRRYDTTLTANYSTSLTCLRSRVKIVGRLLFRQSLDRSFDPHLIVQLWPVEKHGCVGVLFQLLTFTALVIGEKGESSVCERLHQNHSTGWLPGICARWEAHCVGFGNLSAFLSLLEPGVKLREGVGAWH